MVANGVVYAAGGSKLFAYSLPITTPQLSISPSFPADYVFGDPAYAARTFTITNIGSMPTSLITDSLSGPDAAQFRLTSDACAGTSLAGGASCTVTASFAPTRSGPRTAWLTSTAAAGGTANALLAGTAQPLTLSPPWKSFDSIFAGSTSPAAVFTVTNLSVGPVGPIANSITPGSGFTITADACAGKTIAAGTSCTVAVKFAPTSSADYAGTLITQAPGYQAEAYVSGRGLSRLALAPSSKDFGWVRAGTTASATFTVTNISPSPAGPITDAIEKHPWSQYLWFSITSDTCAGTTLATNSSCTVVVTFAPTSIGYSLGWLRTAAPLAGAVTAQLAGGGT